MKQVSNLKRALYMKRVWKEPSKMTWPDPRFMLGTDWIGFETPMLYQQEREIIMLFDALMAGEEA